MSICGCFSHPPPTPPWGPGLQPRHVPDWESNQRPFGLQPGTQSTEPHQPGLNNLIFKQPFPSPYCSEVTEAQRGWVICINTHGLEEVEPGFNVISHYSKCGLWSGSILTPWQPVRNAEPQAPPQLYRIRIFAISVIDFVNLS